MPKRITAKEPPITSARMKLAVRKIKTDCRRKDETSVLRWKGLKRWWRREKKKEPTINTIDFTQPDD
jgi:hypothetical protein